VRRTHRFLLNLYPSNWRERYGAELAALLEDCGSGVRDYATVLWSALKLRLTSRVFVRVIAPCGLLGLFIALATSVGPPQFTSTAVLWVSSQPTFGACGPQEDLPPGLQGPSRQACEDSVYGTDKIARTWIHSALDVPFLISTIEKMNLYTEARRHMPLDQVAQKMLDDIHLVPRGRKDYASQEFELQFSYSDPQITQRATATLISHAFDPKRLNLWLPHFPMPRELRIGMATPPSLPRAPTGLSRFQRSMVGLAIGLLGGVLMAKTFRLTSQVL
jgi:hypothetical protein